MAAANLAEVTVPMPSSAPQERAQAALAAANALQIVTAEDYRQAAAELQALASKEKEIEEARVKLKKPIDDAAKAVQAFFKPPLDFLAQAKGIIKTKLVTWDQEQERKRRAEQARLDEIARQERLRREAQAREADRVAREKAEAARREAEAQRQAAERARREAEEAKRAGDDAAAAAAQRVAQEAARAATRLETKAEATEQRGAERAEALQARAATVVAPMVQADIPKVAGVINRDNWRAECFDLKALVQAVAEGSVPLSLVMANDKVLGQQARSLKEHFSAPGVRVYNDRTKAAGAA